MDAGYVFEVLACARESPDHSPSGGFGSTPVLVLSAGHDALPPDALTEKLAIHRELAATSTNGRAVVIEQSGHFIPLEFPDTVVWAVRDVVERARRR